MRRVLFFLPLLLAGCGEPATTRISPAATEVRGEPISKPAATNVLGPQNSSALVKPVLATTQPPVTGKGEAPLAAPSTFAASTAPPTHAASAGAGGYPLVGFDKLSGYSIEISDDLLGPVTNDLPAIKAKTESLIPESVKAYSTKRVSLRGFMLPLKVEGGLVTELLIMKDQSMCCYGTVPKIHEWVSVKMAGKGVKPVMDQPVSLQGTLHVGEMRENGYLTGIYQMDGDQLGPEEP